jgi:hypothetical protein
VWRSSEHTSQDRIGAGQRSRLKLRWSWAASHSFIANRVSACLLAEAPRMSKTAPGLDPSSAPSRRPPPMSSPTPPPLSARAPGPLRRLATVERR